MHEDKLVQAAWAVRELAYAPYSRFKVGAAVETDNGHIYTGCNVESASYGCTICAERSAIAKAVSEGQLRRGGLARILVAAATPRPVSPCGACRQLIEEFANPDTRVLLSHRPGEIAENLRHADLLPHSFNESSLDER